MVQTFKKWWHRLAPWPCGKWLFSKGVAFLIPYTGTISPYVEELRAGYALVSMKDRRRTRNHLRCFHALALANIGELTTGLALHFSLQNGGRAILTNLNIDYLKKARGKISAISELKLGPDQAEGPIKVLAQLYDEKGDIVAKVSATWLVGFS